MEIKHSLKELLVTCRIQEDAQIQNNPPVCIQDSVGIIEAAVSDMSANLKKAND